MLRLVMKQRERGNGCKAAMVLPPDLVLCNRFGSLEATNGGFVAELLALLERGIPVSTAVAPAQVDAWQRFIGEAPLLPVDPVAWAAWLDAVLLQRGRSAEVPARLAAIG